MQTPDAELVTDRLGLPAASAAWVRGLAACRPVTPRLPARATAPELLARLAVEPADAAEILAGWPPENQPPEDRPPGDLPPAQVFGDGLGGGVVEGERGPERDVGRLAEPLAQLADRPSADWPEELRWLLARVVAVVRADLGGADWLAPGPSLPRERGPAWKHFYTYVYLALLEDVLAYHARHGVPEAVSWATLADLGRNLAIDRRMKGDGWPVMLEWLTLHVRGGLYELGRLQYQRGLLRAAVPGAGAYGLALHIPRSGPLTPAACDESFRFAQEFFPRHFPSEPYEVVTCVSWLLDPRLADLLPEDSNVVRFQRRFRLLPGHGRDAGEDLMRFVFGTLTTPPDELPARTALQRAVLAHLRSGGRWEARAGWRPLNAWHGA